MTEIVSHDPDGIKPCYSDHAEDIRLYGACTACGSGEANVVGHVYPAIPRVKGMDPIEAAELVHSSQTIHMVDGVLLDTFSASHVVAVYRALSAENQARLRTWPLVKVVDTCFRLVNRPRQAS